MKKVLKLITFFIVLSILFCFDIIMNYVSKDVPKIVLYISYFGRFSIGYFSCKPLYDYIYKELTK